ncbi:glycosyltransferase family A protein [Leptothoe sp. LEGE 181152]|nr:glycosyltransferase family A protein [Leptothoe sp. LEGE 181152]
MDCYSPLVSIVIPCYNAENYVSEAIDSALSQSYANVEVIVVDDGSSDQSRDIVQSYGEKVRFKQNHHQGACCARNTGLEISQGEFIQFLDADDVLLPHKLETQLPFLVSNQYDLVFCNGYLFGDDRPQRPIKKLRALPSPTNTDPFIYCFFNGFGTEGPLHRRSLLEKVGGFRAGLVGAQEYDLHVRLSATGARLHKLDDYLFCHRNHNDPNRITRTPKPPGFYAEMLIGLLVRLQQDSPEALTPERRQIFAGVLFQRSINAYRSGAEAIAARGFKQAKALSNKLEYNERRFYKLIAEVVDPMFAEGCLKQARMIRDTLKKPFNSSLAGIS